MSTTVTATMATTMSTAMAATVATAMAATMSTTVAATVAATMSTTVAAAMAATVAVVTAAVTTVAAIGTTVPTVGTTVTAVGAAVPTVGAAVTSVGTTVAPVGTTVAAIGAAVPTVPTVGTAIAAIRTAVATGAATIATAIASVVAACRLHKGDGRLLGRDRGCPGAKAKRIRDISDLNPSAGVINTGRQHTQTICGVEAYRKRYARQLASRRKGTHQSNDLGIIGRIWRGEECLSYRRTGSRLTDIRTSAENFRHGRKLLRLNRPRSTQKTYCNYTWNKTTNTHVALLIKSIHDPFLNSCRKDLDRYQIDPVLLHRMPMTRSDDTARPFLH